MLGTWQQVLSSAGECRRCQVRLVRENDFFAVTANNGWAGRVQSGVSSSALTATGIGRWKPTAGGPYAGKFFRITLAAIGGRLHLELIDSQRRVVRAVFERVSPLDL